MTTETIKVGDTVEYRDRDRNRWGPWIVEAVDDETLIVRVEGVLSFVMPIDQAAPAPEDA